MTSKPTEFAIWKNAMLQFWYGTKGLYQINKELTPEYLHTTGTQISNSKTRTVPGSNLESLYKLYAAGKCPTFDSTYLVGYFTNNTGFDAAITISREFRTISVVFRGSEEPLDWIANANIIHTSMEIPGMDIPPEAKVHSGAWNQLRKDDCIGQIARIVYEVTQQFAVDGLGDYYIVVSGHSLGGGLADIFTYILQLYLEQYVGPDEFRNIISITYNPCPYITKNIADYLESSSITNICLVHEYDPLYTATYTIRNIPEYTSSSDMIYSIGEDGSTEIVSKDEPPAWTEWDLVKRAVSGYWDSIRSYHSFDNLLRIDSLKLVGAGGDGGAGGEGPPTNPAKALIDEHKRLMKGVGGVGGVGPPTTH